MVSLRDFLIISGGDSFIVNSISDHPVFHKFLLLLNYFQAAQVLAQHFGHHHGAVGSLVLLHHGRENSGGGETRAVQGVHEFDLAVGAAATSLDQLASIFLTTTIAPAVATVVCMIFTWVKYGKPDVSMCLNASLAGLVAITAPCDVTDALGSIVIGGVAGVLVVFGVWLLDYKLHVDDPVGAVAVHCMNGIWGTLAVGLFATPTAPGYSIANAAGKELKGLFYGGGFELMGLQLVLFEIFG